LVRPRAMPSFSGAAHRLNSSIDAIRQPTTNSARSTSAESTPARRRGVARWRPDGRRVGASVKRAGPRRSRRRGLTLRGGGRSSCSPSVCLRSCRG
jgi:hypothetical protein